MAYLFADACNAFTATLAVIVVTAYLYVKYLYGYWDRRGIKCLKPTFPFGNMRKTITLRSSMVELSSELYNSTTEPFIGAYTMFRPFLLIRDPDLAQKIMVKDSNHFPNRGVYYDEQRDPLSAHLFAIEGQKWKTLRAKLSPTFTSGKLKAMFPTILSCCEILDKHLAEKADQKGTIEVRELSASHSMNIIASFSFGIDINCIADPENEFRFYGRKVHAPTLKNALRHLLKLVHPKMFKLLRMKLIDDDVEKFMISLVKQNIEFREKNEVARKDFFQLLIQLRNGIDVVQDDQWKLTPRSDGKYDLTIEEVAAQAFMFFVAGFETSSMTLSWCLYELSLNPAIQKRVQNEIDEVLVRYNGEFTYESLKEMTYLEMCLDGELFSLNFNHFKVFIIFIRRDPSEIPHSLHTQPGMQP